MNVRRVRLGLGVSLFVATVTIAGLTAPPAGAAGGGATQAQATFAPSSGTATPLAVPGTPVPNVPKLNGNQPTPFPLNTLGPLTGETSLPYPAYGTPVPGINSGTPAPGISATISLSDAEMVSFARSPALATARNDVAVQAAAVRLQRAGLLPSLTGGASYNYDHSQPQGGGESSVLTTTTGTGDTTGSLSTRSSTTNAGFNLALRQLIYDGGKIANAVRAASSSEVSTADTYRRELQTVAFNVASAYYTYLADERTTQVDLEIVREDLVQEDLVRAQVRAGTAARSDIATAQLPVAQARLAVVRAQGAELSAEATFANAMGLDANSKVQPVDDSPVFTANQVSSIALPPYDVALKRALALRPDYDSAEQSVASEQYSLKSAKLGLFPTLSASAAAQDNSTDANAGTFRNAQSIGLALSIPIYDQGVTAANVAEAKANLNNAFANLQTTALTVQLNIKQALTGIVTARAALDQTQQEYATALVNVQATQAQYRAGVTTLPLLLNAQVQLTQALTDQVTAVYTLRQSEQTYLYAVGSNYDTSASNGKSTISPVPGPEAQGGQVAAKPKKSAVAAKTKKKAANGGTVFSR
jgi:outer membrane protein